MVTLADVPGSRSLPRYRASHVIKRLPSNAARDGDTGKPSREPLAADLQSCHAIRRLPSNETPRAMVTLADAHGSRLLPRYRAGHAVKRLPSRQWDRYGRPLTPTETPPIALLSAFAGFRARSR
jgi:hypothetical protein